MIALIASHLIISGQMEASHLEQSLQTQTRDVRVKETEVITPLCAHVASLFEHFELSQSEKVGSFNLIES